MKEITWFEEAIRVEEYEICGTRITRTNYDFRCYRETKMFEDDDFWMDEKDEVYTKIHVTRLA